MSATNNDTTLAFASQPSDRSTGFVAVESGTEQYSGGKLLVTAYALVWVVLMAWIYVLFRKQQKLGRELDELEQAIERASKGSRGASDAAGAPTTKAIGSQPESASS